MLLLGSAMVTVLATFFVLICLMMMGLILIQKPRGGGLSGAFGGAGGNAQSAFGAKTGDFLTWFTVSCFVLFLILAIGLTWAIKPSAYVAAPVVEPASKAPTDSAPASTPAPTPAPAPGSGGQQP